MNEKQQQLTFEKGITNVPSDALCSDNCLSDCIGMVYDDGEHKVIQKPVKLDITIPSGSKLVGIHVFNGNTRYIIKGTTMVQWTADGENINDIVAHQNGNVQAQAIGKTLVISTLSGLYYLLWHEDSYYMFGNALPDIDINFSLADGGEYQDPNLGAINMGDSVRGTPSTIQCNGYVGAGSMWREGKYEDGKSALIGLVAQRLNKVKEEKKFAFPFWIRFALRLYDGSNTKLSNPILIMPTVKNNWKVYVSEYMGGGFKVMDEDSGGWPWANYQPYRYSLKYQVRLPIGLNLDDWEDVIRGVDVYASEEVKTFDIEGDWTIENFAVQEGGVWKQNPKYNNSDYPIRDFCDPTYSFELIPPVDSVAHMNTYYRPTALSEDEIKEQLIEKSTFYKLFELDLDDLRDGTLKQASDKIRKGALLNLTTQDQLEHDDYYSHTSITPSVIKAYNSRLHIANISRSFFNGYENFSYSAYSGELFNTLYFFTYINSDSGDRIIKKTVITKEIENLWFYYPDQRAYKVEIFKGGNKLHSFSLKEHPYLNGAYYFGDLPYSGETQGSGTAATEPTVINAVEILENQLMVSEVNNPYIFNVQGYIRVGMGCILGMASQTESVGQEEHGTHPLIVFTDRGIQLLRVNGEGLYTQADPSKRDVCNNQASITETDGAVFFSTKRGLMVMIGNDTKCVSEQMSGKDSIPFNDFLKTAFIAYDYRDSLLWIFDGAEHTESTPAVVGSQYCYVYSLKNGTFTRYDFGSGNIVISAINNYPDHLFQMGQDVYSLLNRPDINHDGKSVINTFVVNKYNPIIVTRPMKLENALALKSILQIRHIYQFSPYEVTETHNNVETTTTQRGTMTLRIFASNNLDEWVELHSLRGTPWKYYKFRFDFFNLIATDRFAGTMLITQERRIDKLR